MGVGHQRFSTERPRRVYALAKTIVYGRPERPRTLLTGPLSRGPAARSGCTPATPLHLKPTDGEGTREQHAASGLQTDRSSMGPAAGPRAFAYALNSRVVEHSREDARHDCPSKRPVFSQLEHAKEPLSRSDLIRRYYAPNDINATSMKILKDIRGASGLQQSAVAGETIFQVHLLPSLLPSLDLRFPNWPVMAVLSRVSNA